MKQVSENIIYYGMMVENKISQSRFYAAIPGSTIVEITEDGKKTLYKHIDLDQAIEYVTTDPFLGREGNEYWKKALEKWGIDNFRFNYYPDDYETEDDFFAKYVDHIIVNMYKNTNLHCYNKEYNEFEDRLLEVYLNHKDSDRKIDWAKVTEAIISNAGLEDDLDSELELLDAKFDELDYNEEKARRTQKNMSEGRAAGGRVKGKKNASKPISIKIIATGEIKAFENKSECMKFLGCKEGAFNRFQKGGSKLNNIFQILD